MPSAMSTGPGPGHGRGEHHTRTPQLHRERGIGGRTGSRVQNDRHARVLHDQLEVVRIADPEPGPDGRAQRHDRGAADVLQLPCEDGVVVRVRQHGEPVVHQRLRRVEQLDRIGQQRALVGDDLQLDHVGAESLTRETGGQYGLPGGEAPRRVRQHPDAEPVEHGQHRTVHVSVYAPHRDRRQLRAGGDERALQTSRLGAPPYP